MVTSHEATVPVVVPCLILGSSYEYPQQPQGLDGFRQFPSQHGYDARTLANLALSDPRACAFLQSWLFFGLLREAFARPNYSFDREDFIQRNISSGDATITTTALPRYLWYWQAARTHDYREDMIELEKTIDDCLQLAHSVLHLVDQQKRLLSLRGGATSNWTVEDRVLLSLSLLGDYLTFARGVMRQYTPAKMLYWESTFLDQVMMASGWCVGELSTLRQECNLSSRYYLSTMDRRAVRRSHERCSNGIPCQANQVDYRTYKTKHTLDCDNENECDEIGPPVEDIARIINQGDSPLVTIHGSYGLETTQSNGRSDHDTPYVAISHVWSDGRGNPWRNCLRHCQLRYIQDLVNNLYEPKGWPVPFWMDTLCIPVGKEHTKSRRAAIVRIAQTFRNADKVLVVDGSLLSCPLDSSGVRRLMQIQYSPWMMRLWTYLEGRVSRHLYYQFQDGAVFGEDLESELVRHRQLVEISETLRSLPEEKLYSSASAIQLIRAIYTAKPSAFTVQYAAMPPQEDPDEENSRQQAIALLEDNREYHELDSIWKPFLAKLGLLDDLEKGGGDDDDDMIRADLESRNFCPVMKHAYNSIASVRGKLAGLIFEQLSDMPDIREMREGNTIARLFEEIAGGCRARTTSWLEDETICVGALLGVDLARIQEIQPMDWWWRKRLDRLDSQKSPYPLARKLGISFTRWTEACQRQRMKTFLAQVQDFPLSIIFWNAPRLGSKDWTWAPRTLLYRDLGSEYANVQGTTKLTSAGLEISTRGWRLGSLLCRGVTTARTWRTLIHSTPRAGKSLSGCNSHGLSMTNRGAAGNALIIQQTEVASPESLRPASDWARVEFLPDDKTVNPSSDSRRTWQDYIDSGMIGELAILYRSQFGVLVRVFETRDGLHLAQHIRLVRVATVTSNEGNIPAVSGTWINGGRWCIA